MADKKYILDTWGGVKLYYTIPGSLITSKEVYYRATRSGVMYNADSYQLDTQLEVSDSGATPYGEYFAWLCTYCTDIWNEPAIYANGEPLIPTGLYGDESCYNYNNGELQYTDTIGNMLSKIITLSMSRNTTYINGNTIVSNYEPGDMPIYSQWDHYPVCDLIGGVPGVSENDIPLHYAVPLKGLDNLVYNENFDDIPRSIEYYGTSTNSAYAVNTVDTRASCFRSLLNDFRNAVLSKDPNEMFFYNKKEVYAPYILNQVNRTISITHAPDICAYSTINFGDNTDPVTIYTAGLHEIADASHLYSNYWSENLSYSHRPVQLADSNHDDDGKGNEDAYLPRMRDYRGVHTYSRDGEYTVTIDTYFISDSDTSSGSTIASHVTSTHTVTINSQVQRDVIYFKVPKEIDHMYYNGVRCILTDNTNDEYNVLALDVTGYDWVLGKISAGRRNAVIFDLPNLADTPYKEYKYNMKIYDENNEFITGTLSESLDYDTVNSLYYKENAGDGVFDSFDQPGTYTVYINLIGVRSDNDDEVELYTQTGTLHYPNYANNFFDETITYLRFVENSYTEMMQPISLSIGGWNGYAGWKPIFSRGSIQVAEFEVDYVRNNKTYLPYIHDERGSSNEYFLSDYPNIDSVMETFPEALTVYTFPTANLQQVSFGDESKPQVCILTEDCIGKTYDLRDVIPWKNYFPSCFCNNAPLELYA